jgi:hypothetical protein
MNLGLDPVILLTKRIQPISYKCCERREITHIPELRSIWTHWFGTVKMFYWFSENDMNASYIIQLSSLLLVSCH